MMNRQEITAERRQHLVDHLELAARRFPELGNDANEVIVLLNEADDLTAQIYDDAQYELAVFIKNPFILADVMAELRDALGKD